MYILATGFEQFDKGLEGDGFHRVYTGSVLVDVVVEFINKGEFVEGVVLSPHLPDYEDFLEDIIIPLRKKGVRIVFLPGAPHGKDTQEWLDKMVPLGVYDYVYDPVKAKDILYRLDHPGVPGEIENVALEAANKRIVDVALPPEPVKPKESLFKKIFGKKPTSPPPLALNEYNPPVIEVEAETINEPAPVLPPKVEPIFSDEKPVSSEEHKRRSLFNREPKPPKETKPPKEKKPSNFNPFGGSGPGVIVDGKFVSEKFEDPLEMLTKHKASLLDAIILPATVQPERIKIIRRDIRARNVVLVVLKGDDSHLKLGADKCIKKLNKATTSDILAYSRQLRLLWDSAQYDKLTGAYTREFFEAWLKEQEDNTKKYCIAFGDMDKFKNINDTYGHDAGDDVLIQFATFLKSNVRDSDIVARWGGDEFVVAMPNTLEGEAQMVIARLCQKWANTDVYASGNKIHCTFSAGVAESGPGIDTVKVADHLLYEAKNEGRNRVQISRFTLAVFLMGDISEEPFTAKGFSIAGDLLGADYVICTVENLKRVPETRTPHVLVTSQLSRWGVERDRPNAKIFSTIDEIIDFIYSNENNTSPAPSITPITVPTPVADVFTPPAKEELPKEMPITDKNPEPPVDTDVIHKTFTPPTITTTEKEKAHSPYRKTEPIPAPPVQEKVPEPVRKTPITVLPGARGTGNSQTIPLHGALYVVCPSKPGLAGEVAVKLAKAATKTALVCAAPESTAAIELNMPPEVLIVQDWRMPRSEAPVDWQGVMVWPIDPFKHMDMAKVHTVHTLVDQIKPFFDIVIVDCAGSLTFCSRTARDEGILVLRKEGDSSDKATEHWLKNNDYNNVLTLSPSDTPEIITADNGYIINKAQWTGYNSHFGQ